MKADKKIDPAAGCINGYTDMTCQIVIDKLMCRAFSKELYQQFKLIKVLDLGQITDILSDQLLQTQCLPATAEACVAFQKGSG